MEIKGVVNDEKMNRVRGKRDDGIVGEAPEPVRAPMYSPKSRQREKENLMTRDK